MNANSLYQTIASLALLPSMLTAQMRPNQDPVVLKHWTAPLYWQLSESERDAAGLTPRAQAPANSLVFVGMTPCRVVDTRSGQGFSGAFGPPSLAAGASRTFPIQSSTTCSIPAGAQAYSLNVTVVPQGPIGFLTAYPTGQPLPLAATLVWSQGSITSNAAIVPGGTSGSVDVYANSATNVVIDINGYYAPLGGLFGGWQVVRAATDSVPSSGIKTAFAICPAGKQVLGGGAVVGYQQGNSFPTDPNGILMESEPTGGNNGWQASGIDNTPGDQWAVIVYAICANVTQ
jgi:hypothetical protein